MIILSRRARLVKPCAALVGKKSSVSRSALAAGLGLDTLDIIRRERARREKVAVDFFRIVYFRADAAAAALDGYNVAVKPRVLRPRLAAACRRLGAPLGPQRGRGAGGCWGRSPHRQRAARDRRQRDTGQSGRGRSRGEARAARARPRPPDRSAPKPPRRPERRREQRARATGGTRAGGPARRPGRAPRRG